MSKGGSKPIRLTNVTLPASLSLNVIIGPTGGTGLMAYDSFYSNSEMTSSPPPHLSS